jgi:hypothetical protein
MSMLLLVRLDQKELQTVAQIIGTVDGVRSVEDAIRWALKKAVPMAVSSPASYRLEPPPSGSSPFSPTIDWEIPVHTLSMIKLGKVIETLPPHHHVAVAPDTLKYLVPNHVQLKNLLGTRIKPKRFP